MKNYIVVVIILVVLVIIGLGVYLMFSNNAPDEDTYQDFENEPHVPIEQNY